MPNPTLKRTQAREVPTDALGRELRTVSFDSAVITRSTEDNADSIGFLGHAAVFNSITTIGGWFKFREQIAPGAFAKTIKEADVRFLINHNPDLVLARNMADTLRLSEDKTGLLTDADMARTSYGEDLAISLERGDVTQMSFAFRVVKEEWDEGDEDSTDPPLRTLKELQLFDVSAVTYPAYTDTDAGLNAAALDTLVRSMGMNGDQRRQLEADLDKIARLNEPASATRHDENSQPVGFTTGDAARELQLLGALCGLS